MENRPTADTVARRALALQLIVDFGWSDNQVRNGTPDVVERVRETRRQILAWAQREGVVSWLSPIERAIWEGEWGALPTEATADCTWQLECLVPLTWALGITESLPGMSLMGRDDAYPRLFFMKPDPVGSLVAAQQLVWGSPVLARSIDEIALLRDAYVLQHWRVRERLLGNKGRYDLRAQAPALFGEEIVPALDILPLTPRGELLFQQYSLVIPELNRAQLHVAERLFQSRQKALAWLCGSETEWDLVTTDT